MFAFIKNYFEYHWFGPMRIMKSIIHDSSSNWRLHYDEYNKTANRKIYANQMKTFGARLYKYKLQNFLISGSLSDETKRLLQDIIEYFELSGSKIKKIKKHVYKNPIRSIIKEAIYNDDQIDYDETSNIQNIADYLNVPAQELNNLRLAEISKIYKACYEKVIEDGRVSDSEEDQLKELKEKLGISETDMKISKESQYKYYMGSLLWQIENGRLPNIETSIVLQANEIAHFEILAVRTIRKMETTGYAGRSAGLSLRIAKGAYYRTGGSASHAIRQNVSYSYKGQLVVTNKRIVFASSEKGFVIPFTSLVNFTPYTNGIDLQKGEINYELEIHNKDSAHLCSLILSHALNKS